MKSVNPSSIEDMLKTSVEEWESKYGLQFHGFDISYVDILGQRLETFSYCTNYYHEITEEGIKSSPTSTSKSSTPGSLILNKKLSIKDTPKTRRIKSVNSKIKTLPKEKKYRESGFFPFNFLNPKRTTITSWVTYYGQKGISGHFVLGGIEDEVVNYRLILFAVVSGIHNGNKSALTVEFSEFIKDKIPKVVFAKFRTTFDEMRKQAIRAGISQVMARNMSHNIGSHVMNKLLSPADINRTLQLDHYHSPIKPTADLIEAIAIFNTYIKARMDYLADVTFGTPVMQTNKKFYGEVFKGFDRNRLLLNNISALGEDFKYEVVFQHDSIELSDANDLEIALPNDLLGCQAFYNVLENIIRNTAKHSKNTPDKVVFIVNVSDCDENPSLYKVEVCDNIIPKSTVEEERKSFRLKEYKKYHPQYKKKDLSEIDWLVFKQNNTLNKSILDEKTNQLRTTALGMIEIETSAAYLRRIDIADIELDEYAVEHNEKLTNERDKLNILKAFNQNGSLGYRFFVLKPSEMLLVGNYAEINDDRKKELLKEGIRILSKHEFEKYIESKEVFNHQFLLYEASELSDTIKTKKTSLPTRIIKLQKEHKEKIQTILRKESFLIELEEFIWSEWNFILLKKHSIENIKVATSVHPRNKKPKWFHAIFLDHGAEWDDQQPKFKPYRELLDDNDFTEGKISYLEALSSNSAEKLPGYAEAVLPTSTTKQTYSENKLTKYIISVNESESKIKQFKLNESILTKILVLDERIQESAVNNIYSYQGVDMPFSQLYEYTNLVMPVKIVDRYKSEKTINLSAKNYDGEINDAIKTYINENLSKGCDFFLFHYSILERMFNSEKKQINDYLKKIAGKTRVVITSGRGKPSKLPDCVSFVNLTPILSAFVENRSKYSINYLLNSSRK